MNYFLNRSLITKFSRWPVNAALDRINPKLLRANSNFARIFSRNHVELSNYQAAFLIFDTQPKRERFRRIFVYITSLFNQQSCAKINKPVTRDIIRRRKFFTDLSLQKLMLKGWRGWVDSKKHAGWQNGSN